MLPLKILITGGCGFIGTSLVATIRAIAPSSSIRILDSLITGSPADLLQVTAFTKREAWELDWNESVALVEGDVRDASLVHLCAQGADCIVHLAANTGVGPSVNDPRHDMECNVIGTFNVLESARQSGVRKFIFASSGAPVGEAEPPIHEEIAPHPVSPYGASKLAGEGYCSAYFLTYGVETVCLRFGNVFGPRSSKKASVVAKFIKQALAGDVCEIFGDGKQTRDFIFIDDLVYAIMLAIEKPVGGETFQIATGIERTVLEVAYLIREVLDMRGINMLIEHHDARVGDVLRNFSDTSKALKVLGWKPRVGIREGIARTLEWFVVNHV